MKLLKQIVLVLLVSLFLFSFSVFSENQNPISFNYEVNSRNIQLNKILKLYNHFQTIDGISIGSIEGILDKNITWKYEGVIDTVPFAGTFIGVKGVTQFWRKYFNSLNVQKAQLRYYLQNKNILHLHWTDEGIVRSTGKRYLMETIQRWEFNEEGKVVKFRWYNDTFALYHAFRPGSDPQLSIAAHPADYNINGDGPIDALPVVQQFYNDFLSGNIPALFSNVSPNFVFIIAAPESIVPHAGTRYGPEGVLDFFNALFPNQQFLQLNLLTFTSDGCRVDVEFQEELLVYATGKLVKNEGVHSILVYTNGQLAKLRSYNDTYINAWGCIND